MRGGKVYKFFFKRIIDFIMALIVFPFCFILFLILCPIIFLEDKGKIFYVAPRLGKDGKVFQMYKYRTMKMDAPDVRNEDGSTYNSENDPRLTRIGKFLRKTSLDETPQFINVLKGDMSMIGPRPDLPEHYLSYENNDSRKLDVRPGITGFNQAYFRNTIPWKERIQNDIYYIDHLSFWIDVKILLRTILSVIQRKDVYVIQECQENVLEQNSILETKE